MRLPILFCLFFQVKALSVQELTPENFNAVVDGYTNTLVMFTAADCVHCVTSKPEYEALAQVLELKHDLILGRVDIDDHPELALKYGVKGAPTYKFFPKGTIEPENFYVVHYHGRLANTLLKLLKKRLSTLFVDDQNTENHHPIASLDDLPALVKHVTKLNGAKYHDFVAKNMAVGDFSLIYIYMPWDDRDDTKIMVQKVGDVIAETGSNIKIGKLTMETVKERTICEETLKVKSWPSFVLIDPKGGVMPYDGDLASSNEMLAFLQKQTNIDLQTNINFMSSDSTDKSDLMSSVSLKLTAPHRELLLQRVLRELKPILVDTFHKEVNLFQTENQCDLILQSSSKQGKDKEKDKKANLLDSSTEMCSEVSKQALLTDLIYPLKLRAEQYCQHILEENDTQRSDLQYYDMAKHYVKIIDKIVVRGFDYIDTETNRLLKLIKSSQEKEVLTASKQSGLSEEHLEMFLVRTRILRQFRIVSLLSVTSNHDEL